MGYKLKSRNSGRILVDLRPWPGIEDRKGGRVEKKHKIRKEGSRGNKVRRNRRVEGDVNIEKSEQRRREEGRDSV